jgi:Zn-dependent peptidase ImmA (M78 family)/transcriptional regulator with XRE-family HTH domain
MTRRAFAERVGLEESKLSKSLSGTRRFSSLDLARIAELCKVSVDWLITGEESALAMAARTTSGNARSAITVARRYSTMREDLAALGYGQPWQPVSSVAAGGFVEQGRQLARAAMHRLSERGSPVMRGNLASAVESGFGIDVAITDLGDGFDGLAVSSAAVRLIVLGTTTLPARQRFTLAHELAHHLAGDDQGVHLDQDVYAPAQAKDPSEMRANAFAAAFLMPEDTLTSAVGASGISQQQFAELACDLMVTPSALAYRLREFRLIDSGTCDVFRKTTAAQAASMAGRGDDLAQRMAMSRTERPPGLLLRDAFAAYEAGASTLRPYASLLGVDAEELRMQLEREQDLPRADD